MATVSSLSAHRTLSPCVAASEHAHGVFSSHASNDNPSSQEVVTFLQRRLKSEREYLASKRHHLAETSGLIFELTAGTDCPVGK